MGVVFGRLSSGHLYWSFLVPHPAGSCWKGNILGAAFITFLYSTGGAFCVGSVYCLGSIGCNILGLPSAKLLLWKKSRIALLGGLCGRSGRRTVVLSGSASWRCVHQHFCDGIFYGFIWGPGTGPSECFLFIFGFIRGCSSWLVQYFHQSVTSNRCFRVDINCRILLRECILFLFFISLWMFLVLFSRRKLVHSCSNVKNSYVPVV